MGLSYIVPVAVLVKWFPDRRGLIRGIAVGGFGAGALLTAPMATTRLISSIGVLHTFIYLGISYMVVAVIAGWFMQNQAADWRPGWLAAECRANQAAVRSRLHLTRGSEDLAMVGSLVPSFPEYFGGDLDRFAGVPMFQEIAKVTAVVAAGWSG